MYMDALGYRIVMLINSKACIISNKTMGMKFCRVAYTFLLKTTQSNTQQNMNDYLCLVVKSN